MDVDVKDDVMTKSDVEVILCKITDMYVLVK